MKKKQKIMHIIPIGATTSLCGVKAIYGKDGRTISSICNCQQCFDVVKKMIDKLAEE